MSDQKITFEIYNRQKHTILSNHRADEADRVFFFFLGDEVAASHRDDIPVTRWQAKMLVGA